MPRALPPWCRPPSCGHTPLRPGAPAGVWWSFVQSFLRFLSVPSVPPVPWTVPSTPEPQLPGCCSVRCTTSHLRDLPRSPASCCRGKQAQAVLLCLLWTLPEQCMQANQPHESVVLSLLQVFNTRSPGGTCTYNPSAPCGQALCKHCFITVLTTI